MKFFVAQHAGISGNARFFGDRVDLPKKDQGAVHKEARGAFEGGALYGKELPDSWYLRMSENFPKSNRFYDLAVTRHPNALLVSERVKAWLESSKLMHGNEALRTRLRDPKDKPIAEDVFAIVQRAIVPCIDAGKSKGTLEWGSEQVFGDMTRVVLDERRMPKRAHLFRAAEFEQLLFLSERVVRGFLDAGFMGLDYVPVEKWIEEDDYSHPHLVKGPVPSVVAPQRKSRKPPERKVPAALSEFLEAHRGKWIDLAGKDRGRGFRAWVFDWPKLTDRDRKMLETDFLEGSALEEPEYVPFAVLHVNFDQLVDELGHKPKTLADAVSMQTDGLLMCDQTGKVLHLDEGSREDVAPSLKRLKLKKTK